MKDGFDEWYEDEHGREDEIESDVDEVIEDSYEDKETSYLA